MAARIKAAIADMPGMTEDRLGAEVGVSQGQVSHWTNGRLPVPSKRAIKLAHVLGLEPSDISVAYREVIQADASVAAQPSHSHHARLDPDKIRQVHKALQRRFAKAGGYDIERNPEIFAIAYEIVTGITDASVPDNVLDLVIQHADLTRHEATDERRGDSVPASGTVG